MTEMMMVAVLEVERVATKANVSAAMMVEMTVDEKADLRVL